MRSSDADEVRRAAGVAGRRVFVAENYAYKPVAEHLRRLIAAGDLGDIRFVSLNATKRQRMAGWRAERTLSGGGALFEGGIHWVSFAANLGLDVAAVTAYRVGATDGPDQSALIVFRYANGAVGTLAHSWELAAPLGGLRLSKVQGTLGAVTFESNGFAAVTTGRRRSVRLWPSATPGLPGDARGLPERAPNGGGPRFTLEMAQRDLCLLEQAERSMAGELGSDSICV
jgi:predicted dehydrogenase